MASRDAIVVLGCRSDAGARAGALARRAHRAAEAWRRGLAPELIVCGGRRWAGDSEAAVLARALIEAGVPPSRIHAEHCSLTTYENVWYSAELLQRLGAKRLFIVTCDFHIPRALRLFGHAGFDCVGLAARTPAQRSHLRRQLSEFASTLIQPTLKQLGPRVSQLLNDNTPPRQLPEAGARTSK